LAAALLASAGAAAQQPLFNMQDLHFMHHMSVHHAQALDMAELVPARSERPEFRQFADYVYRAQLKEIDMMQSLIDLAAERGIDVHMMPLDGDPPMAGMLSSAQMRALEEASGAEFERLWLEGMIYHHQGAIDMAEAQQAQQLESGRRPYRLAVLVEEIIVEQRGEITKMRDWLVEWELSAPD
jgi:uncharacterized protein (DUF305 family)